MARYTIHRKYEDKQIEKDKYLKQEMNRLKLYMLLIVLKGGNNG